MIRVTGSAYIAKKEIRAVRDGFGGEKFMNLRLKNDKEDREFYIASIKAKEDASIFALVDVGDQVNIDGIWKIKRNKQSDGSFRYYNVIYLDTIEPM